METFVYEKTLKHENSYWWFGARRKFIETLLERHLTPSCSILDLGAGTGYLMEKVQEKHPVTLMDFSDEAVRICKQKGFKVFKGSVTEIPFGDASFDAVTCFDVLYHKETGPLEKAVQEIHRVLRPRGVLLLTEPAFSWLAGKGHTADHGARRFQKKELKTLFCKAGFEWVAGGYFNTILFPLIVFLRLVQKMERSVKTRTEFGELPSTLNWLLKNLALTEIPLAKGGKLPFGVSVFAILRVK